MLAYFDISAGISGDMTLGALVDAGLPIDVLHETIDALGLAGEVEITAEQVRKGTLVGTKVGVVCRTENVEPHRHLEDILALINGSPLPASVREKAAAVFRRLGEAEARVHGIPVEEVHFHEVGALDAIVDIVGAVAGLHALGVTRVVSSPVPLSRGYANTAHGRIPVPAPATTELLVGIPVYGLDLDVETVTPTGAALITTLADNFAPIPPMTLQSVGYGAGTFDLPLPNVLRLLLGEPTTSPTTDLYGETLSLLSTNVDDMPGEWFGPLFDELLAAGALDVWFTPIQMKKNRPAVMISALAEPPAVPTLRLILLRETTTLGVREETVTRWRVPWEVRTVRTPWGEVRVKVAHLPGGSEKMSPEFEDCRRLAQEHQVPLREVYLAALSARLKTNDE
ncbi:MAG: nickel pincer cofactor biosynthesis protein LarC [Anaerolineae bacterium]